jgi:hypothetical protein
MRFPRVRFTVQRMMIVIATLAVSWCMLLGINALHNLAYDVGDAPGIGSDEHQVWLSRGITTLTLIGLGCSMGVIGLAVRAKPGAENSARPALIKTLATVCSLGMKIVFIGLILGGVVYMGIYMYVFLFLAPID